MLGPAGAASLAAGLVSNRALEDLGLQLNPIGAEGARLHLSPLSPDFALGTATRWECVY